MTENTYALLTEASRLLQEAIDGVVKLDPTAIAPIADAINAVGRAKALLDASIPDLKPLD